MKRLLGVLLAGTAGAMVLAGSAGAAEEGKLLLWIIGDKGYKGIQAQGEKFKADLGVEVAVEPVATDGGTDKWQQAASAGKGPDIWCWPHDRLGTWAAAGLLSPIEPSPEVKSALVQTGWDAFTYDGKIWGYPLSVESVSLIYNKDLVPNPPKTFDEVIKLNEELKAKGKRAIMWPTQGGAVPYFNWPILAANGAMAFEKGANGFDVKKTGVSSPSAMQGAKLVKELVDKGVLATGVDPAVMDSAFSKGDVAMVINGPWSWANYKDVNFGVAPIPAVGSEPGKPFVGVLGCMVNKASPNKDLVKEFMEKYVVTPEGMKAIDADKPLGAAANKAYFEQLAADPKIKVTMENSQRGQPMPNIPEMGKFWQPLQAAIENIVAGKQPVEAALTEAASRITQ